MCSRAHAWSQSLLTTGARVPSLTFPSLHPGTEESKPGRNHMDLKVEDGLKSSPSPQHAPLSKCTTRVRNAHLFETLGMEKTRPASYPSPGGIIHQVGLKLGLQEGWQANLCKLPPGVTCSGHSLAKGHNGSLPYFLIRDTLMLSSWFSPTGQ